MDRGGLLGCQPKSIKSNKQQLLEVSDPSLVKVHETSTYLFKFPLVLWLVFQQDANSRFPATMVLVSMNERESFVTGQSFIH